MKKAGILMPVASLPDRHGCGSFGKEAYRFIDRMKEAGLTIWQILPLNPLGYGNSPYQPYSSYAMDDIYLSLDILYERGLLSRRAPSYRRRSKQIDYDAVRRFRDPYLHEAYRNFRADMNYAAFSYQSWVRSYAIFMTFKKKNGMKCWLEWPEDEKNQPQENGVDLKAYEDEILYEAFLQYMLYLQWKDLKQYANDAGILIMGDIPFYVGIDSADVWADRSSFLLESDGRPSFIAGVPPDYFAKYGQRWGNPIYDWDYLQKTDFRFWLERLAYTDKMFDITRVDHFRAFDTYWKIPSSCPTAVEGEWIEAPGYALFDVLFDKMPDMEIVAEDLGDLRYEVHVLRDHYNFRGMRVIQFSFDSSGMPEDREHLSVYTGTHDNDPIFSWYRGFKPAVQRQMRHCLKRMGYDSGSFVHDVIRYSLHSAADMVIIPMADWLHKGHEARLNTPGTVGAPNWMWRMSESGEFASVCGDIRKDLEEAGRIEE